MPRKRIPKDVNIQIALDSEIIAQGGIKVGDKITGHVVITNQRVLSCNAIYIGVLARLKLLSPLDAAKFSPNIVAVISLIQNGRTQNGREINIKALQRGIHKLPFTLKIPEVNVGATFSSDYAEYTNVLIVKVGTSTGIYTESIPICIKEHANIRYFPEYEKFFNVAFDSCLNLELFRRDEMVVTSPRHIYTISEDKLPFTINVGNNEKYIKSIEAKLVLHKCICMHHLTFYRKEETILSKKLTQISKIIEDEFEIPPGIEETAAFYSTNSKWPIFVGQVHLIMVIAETSKCYVKHLQNAIPIHFGTVDEPIEIPSSTEAPGIHKSQFSLLPAYSELSINSNGIFGSTTSLETMPPSFEEAMKMLNL